MKTETRLIFGIRTSEAVSLTVTADGPLPPQPPDLRIKTGEQDIAVSCRDNAWVAPLGAGDHVVYMPAPGDGWFDAQLTFTLSAPATIVSYPDKTRVLLTWTATASTSDPKNPWPPPLDGNDIASLANSTWLSSTLTTMMAEIAIERSAPPYVPPASGAEPDRSR